MIITHFQTSYFRAYSDFFSQVVRERGAIAALEEYVFSFDCNFSHAGEHPAMLSRCLALIFHPLILIGYGIEFNIPGLVAEGIYIVFGEEENLMHP